MWEQADMCRYGFTVAERLVLDRSRRELYLAPGPGWLGGYKKRRMGPRAAPNVAAIPPSPPKATQ